MGSDATSSPETSRKSTQIRKRLPLGASRGRLSYEKRIRLWLAVFLVPLALAVGWVVFDGTQSAFLAVGAGAATTLCFSIAASFFFEQLIRPLQTLANVVAALREDDFSFRARGARRGDSLGDLALEINALASTLQTQRAAARDALTLVERVITSMQSPVLAFDAAGALRLINPAAEDAFQLVRRFALGRTAEELQLTMLLQTVDQELYSGDAFATPRWSVRRTTFRLQGVPHILFVLADVAAALREEERIAWQRLIRVLSHEINNSLTPIKSIAGSLRTRLPERTEESADLHRGLLVIEDRAASLNRFLQGYQQLTRLPPPVLAPTSLAPLLAQVVALETRLAVELQQGPPATVLADADQLQQLLINLIRNAVEAARAQGTAAAEPHVCVTWTANATHVAVQIRDNGAGLLDPSNLFVPFYTTKPEGSGIGLVLAQQIASALKGSVSLSNNPGAPGCTAEVRLPAYRPSGLPEVVA